MHAAAQHGSVELLRVLLEWQAHVSPAPFDGVTPLLLAAAAGNQAAVAELNQAGASITVADNKGDAVLNGLYGMAVQRAF